MKGLLFLVLLGCIGYGYSINTDDLSNFCGRSLLVSSAELLSMNNYQSDWQCVVTIYSQFHYGVQYDNKLRLKIRNFNMPCGSSYMDIYDGSQFTGNRLSRITCDSYYQTDYLTTNNNFMTLVIYPHEYYTTMSLLATGTSYNYQSGDFVCSNGYCIDSSLQCDGYNNCGDWSDETSSLCYNYGGVFNWSLRVVIIAACSGVVGFIIIVVAIVLIVRRRRRLNIQYQGLVNPAQPGYGTIQGSGAYMTQPPPYSPKGGIAGYPQPQYGAAYSTPATATATTVTSATATTTADTTTSASTAVIVSS